MTKDEVGAGKEIGVWPGVSVKVADGMVYVTVCGMECGVFWEEPLEVAVVVSRYDVYGYCFGDGGEEFFDVYAFLYGDLWDGVFDITKDNKF